MAKIKKTAQDSFGKKSASRVLKNYGRTLDWLGGKDKPKKTSDRKDKLFNILLEGFATSPTREEELHKHIRSIVDSMESYFGVGGVADNLNKDVSNLFKQKKTSEFLCCMCHKELGYSHSGETILSTYYVCVNPICPNYSLLCISEELMVVKKKGTNGK